MLNSSSPSLSPVVLSPHFSSLYPLSLDLATFHLTASHDQRHNIDVACYQTRSDQVTNGRWGGAGCLEEAMFCCEVLEALVRGLYSVLPSHYISLTIVYFTLRLNVFLWSKKRFSNVQTRVSRVTNMGILYIFTWTKLHHPTWHKCPISDSKGNRPISISYSPKAASQEMQLPE